MYRIPELNANPPLLSEKIQFPEQIRNGRYDAFGRRTQQGVLHISVKDTSFIWCVFTQPLKAGQVGEITLTSVPGTFLAGASFNEWDPVRLEPAISDARFQLISAQRGPDTVRIVGRNVSNRDLHAAAGIVIADDASYYP